MPPALVRFLEHDLPGPRLVAGDFAAFAQGHLEGGHAATVSRGGHGLLWVYNTFVSLANLIGPLASTVSLDVARLPPAETFSEFLHPGFVRFSLRPDGCRMDGHRLFQCTSGALFALGTVGAAAVAGGFAIPTFLSGREEAYKVQCANNLKQLFTFAMISADKTGRTHFPHDPDGSVATFRALQARVGNQLHPGILVCPAGAEFAAELVANGRFQIEDHCCSYEFIPARVKITQPGRMLIYDRGQHHDGGRNVVFTDGAVRFLLEGEFQRRLQAELAEEK
jgi:hypothetical protein